MSDLKIKPNSSMHSKSSTEDIDKKLVNLDQILDFYIQDIKLDKVPKDLKPQSPFNQNPSLSSSLTSTTTPLKTSTSFPLTIQELLLTINRDKMLIEDIRSEELRKSQSEYSFLLYKNPHELEMLKNEIKFSLKTQRNSQLEKEKKNFEDKLEDLDRLKDEYTKKKNLVICMYDKLIEKEALLDQKEKDFRMSRIAFDRHRMLWENEVTSNTKILEEGSYMKFDSLSPERIQVKPSNRIKPGTPLPNFRQFKEIKGNNVNSRLIVGHKRTDSYSSLTFNELQEELKNKEIELEKCKSTGGFDTSKLEVQIDQMQNRLAILRGEKAMTESIKTSKLVNSMVFKDFISKSVH
ncbi:hypothetical protein SteCoe_16996 [Stentor coeruleus]|uniref:Uncharacterized protein n=1 Tax=Stentor coeruleus TaxID=5963 RepID=A0A1R2C075_9CILI|nr:hypothetical protein SteCoe_16996 [Stentor coeruleus]